MKQLALLSLVMVLGMVVGAVAGSATPRSGSDGGSLLVDGGPSPAGMHEECAVVCDKFLWGPRGMDAGSTPDRCVFLVEEERDAGPGPWPIETLVFSAPGRRGELSGTYEPTDDGGLSVHLALSPGILLDMSDDAKRLLVHQLIPDRADGGLR